MEYNKDIEGLTYLKWSMFNSPEKGEEDSGYKFMDRKTVLILDQVVHDTKMVLDNCIELAYATPFYADMKGLVSFSAHRVGKAVRFRIKDPKKRMRLIGGLCRQNVKRICVSREVVYFDTDDLQPEVFHLWDTR